MQMTYFADTDMLEITLGAKGPVARVEDGSSEDILLAFDEAGRLRSLILEHARQAARLGELRRSPAFERLEPACIDT